MLSQEKAIIKKNVVPSYKFFFPDFKCFQERNLAEGFYVLHNNLIIRNITKKFLCTSVFCITCGSVNPVRALGDFDYLS